MAYWRLCYHFVWTTKERWPYITAEVEPALYRWLYNEAKKLYCPFCRICRKPKTPYPNRVSLCEDENSEDTKRIYNEWRQV